MATIDDLTNEVADLVDATTSLLVEVGNQKDSLQVSVDISTANAQTTNADVILTNADVASAGTSETNAANSAVAAQQSADDAVAVVTGGTATLVAEAGKIPLADAEGIIDINWLPAEVTGRNVFAEEQQANNEKYAASGFVHFGKQYSSVSYFDVIAQGYL